ncbi:MAG: membrane protein related to metalloendopeptidase [Stygiobacter sp.]|nr:MAG: membrane protein related to metalloendopeptidase [Stygiobacter sp.]
MRVPTLHLVLRLIVLVALPLIAAGCSSSFQGGTPVSRGMPSSPACSGTVVVYAGDTLYSIARRCNVSVRDLIETNQLAAPYLVSPGMQLRMPGSGEYVVQRGDALSLIARRLGVEFQTLARLNGKVPPYTIFVGEKLRLPNTRGGATAAKAGDGASVVASTNSNRKGGEPATASPRIPPVPAETSPTESAPIQEARHPAFEPRQTLPPAPPAMSGKGFIWPVKGDLLAEFGPMGKGLYNDGINIAAARGTPVRAAENGVVAFVGNEVKGNGNLLLIKHAGGWISTYAHNDQLMVRKGDMVKRGQQISTVGVSGGVDTPQLHFELRRGIEAINPVDYLSGS